ncbi:1-(5-phosphoribosyl)-5-[(5-phosphoribosylamino)methylideneamino]imidazole-4-carboxamide isomerase [bacterium]
MKIIPAIDLRNGNCVRLEQGKLNKETIYSNSPQEMAKLWENKGAKRLHLVDLDGAFTGSMINFEVIKKIRQTVNLEIDVGGGIRTVESAEKLINLGIDKIIFGTIAVTDPEIVEKACGKFKEKITIGIDAFDGKIAIKGWEGITEIKADTLINQMEKLGVSEFIYTDISKDGMLAGPNTKAIKKICSITTQNIIASGGISNLDDIKALLDLKMPNLIGAITGKAIYAKTLDLEKAIELVENYVS